MLASIEPAAARHAGEPPQSDDADALGESERTPEGRYRPVEAGVADVDSLGESFRVVPKDLRAPIGFERVYRVPGLAGEPERFARISGGLYAVFPRSVYSVTRKGAKVIEVPAGTVFYIGDPARDAGWGSPRTVPTDGEIASFADTGVPGGVSSQVSTAADTRADGANAAHVSRRKMLANQLGINGSSSDEIDQPGTPGSDHQGDGPEPETGDGTGGGVGGGMGVGERPSGPVNVMTDSGERNRRVRALLRDAARAR